MSETSSTSSSDFRRHSLSLLAQRAVSAITLRRVGLSIAGTFAFAGAVAALNGNHPAETPTTKASSQNVTTQVNHAASTTDSTGGTTPNASANSSSNTSFSSTTTNGVTNTHLTVNGQDVPVPANGSTQQTITNDDGSQTTVNTSTSSTGQGGATNTNSTNFSVTINNNASSSGGSTTQ